MKQALLIVAVLLAACGSVVLPTGGAGGDGGGSGGSGGDGGTTLSVITGGIVTTTSEPFPCDVCDEIVCRISACDNGTCVYSPADDGTRCPTGRCRSGACVTP